MDRKKVISTFRKLHKWPGIIIAVFAIHFAFSGIVMSHRDLFSAVDVSRKWMPGTYEYKFCVDGQWQPDPENPNFMPNDLGTLNSVLVVE